MSAPPPPNAGAPLVAPGREVVWGRGSVGRHGRRRPERGRWVAEKVGPLDRGSSPQRGRHQWASGPRGRSQGRGRRRTVQSNVVAPPVRTCVRVVTADGSFFVEAELFFCGPPHLHIDATAAAGARVFR